MSRPAARRRVYFLAIFPALVWLGAYTFRRQWPAFVIVVSGLLTALAITSAVGAFTSMRPGDGFTIFHLFAFAYCAVVTLVGFMIACTRRGKAPERCHRCSYDISGNESGLCPECGYLITPPPPAKPRTWRPATDPSPSPAALPVQQVTTRRERAAPSAQSPSVPIARASAPTTAPRA